MTQPSFLILVSLNSCLISYSNFCRLAVKSCFISISRYSFACYSNYRFEILEQAKDKLRNLINQTDFKQLPCNV